MRCRPQTLIDLEGIDRVHTAAFETDAEAKLVRALRENGRLPISLVAEDRGEIVGHVAFSPVAVLGGVGGTDPGQTEGLGLAPVGVMPSHQGRGIGGDLIRAGLIESARLGFSWCVVLGDPAYYSRFGFVAASRMRLGNEYGVDEPFMALELIEGSLNNARGVVRYAPEFADLE